MTKTWCDSCKDLCDKDGRLFNVPCHVAEGAEGVGGYVVRTEGGKIVETSGRLVRFELCAKCYDRVHRVAFAAIKDPKVESR